MFFTLIADNRLTTENGPACTSATPHVHKGDSIAAEKTATVKRKERNKWIHITANFFRKKRRRIKIIPTKSGKLGKPAYRITNPRQMGRALPTPATAPQVRPAVAPSPLLGDTAQGTRKAGQMSREGEMATVVPRRTPIPIKPHHRHPVPANRPVTHLAHTTQRALPIPGMEDSKPQRLPTQPRFRGRRCRVGLANHQSKKSPRENVPD